MTSCAILAWGSLIWKHPAGNYIMKDTNIELPIQFSRISDNKKGRCTLVIDYENGILNKCKALISTDKECEPMRIFNCLKKREKTINKHIHFINFETNENHHNLKIKEVIQIKNWCSENDIKFICWTGLPSNIEKFSYEFIFNYINEQEKTNFKLYCLTLDYILRCLFICKISNPELLKFINPT